ncbi:MAG: hypothetical protein ACM3UN_01185, partial [Bacillota bacterium]
MKKPSFKISGVKSWYQSNKQKRKEKDDLERHLESSALKMVTFLFTAIAMGVGMSILPLFPQPLPIFVAILIAFITFKIPRVGMPIGGAIIGLGLMYHLAQLYFISFLGDIQVRVAFIVIWMVLFVVPPSLFNRYKSALATDFGILAVTTLFIGPIYFLAIPLLLASAVFFKKYVSLSIIYFVLLSVPLQIMQYFQYTVLPIVRSDWWLEPGSAPPLLVPLTSIGKDLASSMTQFRLYDLSKVFYDIAGQTTWTPDWTGRTIGDAVTQYRDSIPGILMFVIVVVGLALTLMFFTQMLVKGGLIGAGDKLFPCFIATIAAALFFILLSALQTPLAFTADVSGITMILGIFATLLFTLPVAFIDYSPKKQASNREIDDKAKALMNKVLTLEGQLNSVKANIPVTVSSPEGKLLIIKDSLEETLRNAQRRAYEQDQLNEKFVELEKFTKDTDALEAELGTILSEFQIFAYCEYSNWAGKLKDAGLNTKTTLQNSAYQKEMLLEQRIKAIIEVLDASRVLTKETIDVTKPIYDIVRSLYDSSLPEKCRAAEFANEKLEKKQAPWIAIEALYNALNNWKRQYGKEIRSSMRYLQSSFSPIASLTIQSDALLIVFGEQTPRVINYAQKAEAMRVDFAKRTNKPEIEVLDIIALKDNIQSIIAMSNDILSTLYMGIISNEEAIDRLLPTKDYMWQKNSSLREQLKKASEILSNPSDYKVNQIMENLPQYLSYIDEAVQTLEVYIERKEFLLNYPLAEAAIEEQLKNKEQLVPQDLPFQQQFAAEYLRLYYSAKFGDYTFDK